MLIAATLPDRTSPMASAAQKNICLQAGRKGAGGRSSEISLRQGCRLGGPLLLLREQA